MTRRFVARVLRTVAAMVESNGSEVLVIEDAPPDSPAPQKFVARGSEEEHVNQVLARMYLYRALTRFSPKVTAHA